MSGSRGQGKALLMSSNENAITVKGLSKYYEIYEFPRDRLKQFIFPRLCKILGLSKRNYFREFWSLREISFEVKKGQTVGVIGRNGSGKSTLLQIICGTLSPTAGNVQTSGRIAALLELGSGFNSDFSGRENVYLNAFVLGLTKDEIDARFEDIVSFADIGDFIDQPIKTYSSGMMVRLAFAVIAHVEADILIIDEALAVGDVFFTQKCMRFLRNFMKTGTVIFVSHDTASIKSLCTNVIWLDKGRIILEGEPKEICNSYLEAFYEVQQKGDLDASKYTHKDELKIHPEDNEMTIETDLALANNKGLLNGSSDASSFGTGRATITSVKLLNDSNRPLVSIAGGEIAVLKVESRVNRNFDSPIIGFYVSDRLGQILFGDNTFKDCSRSMKKCVSGDIVSALFSFRMPMLAAGNYSITVAVASGTLQQHEQLHWIHDAIVFKSESTNVSGGLVGIPMQYVKLEVLHAKENDE